MGGRRQVLPLFTSANPNRVLFECELTVNGEVKPAYQISQFLVVLDHAEQVHEVAVVVVEDLFLCPRLSEEHLGAAHTGLDVDTVLRHHGQDGIDDAALVS